LNIYSFIRRDEKLEKMPQHANLQFQKGGQLCQKHFFAYTSMGGSGRGNKINADI
jgi:hypothetical protein